VGRAQLVLEVGEGPIEVRGGQVERAGINAHQALHQPLQRVEIFNERFAEAGQAVGPLIGAPETPAGDDVGMVGGEVARHKERLAHIGLGDVRHDRGRKVNPDFQNSVAQPVKYIRL
jgi:hypothetical protein